MRGAGGEYSRGVDGQHWVPAVLPDQPTHTVHRTRHTTR